ncbi:hypothetical protein MIND_00272200 [Mycena indigotica]|uniref:Uncharacterized protein n=1 Tax=Mycena indigotica TaxID=2126181 RepID=A0A8H6T9B4_9AGAR|nr:uncharacterized protein MIND_00272200 [Mycena indigotica]KAF7312581.1 hypothetical protein MIND_00272200 [Mycena indigotica]
MELVRTDTQTRPPITTTELALALRQPLQVIGPGRTIQSIYQSVGNFFERKANKFACRFGLGPLSICERVEDLMGAESAQREAAMQELRLGHVNAATPKLRKACWRLLQYALPTEAPNTQMDAFNSVVLLVTRYPGLRALFLSAPQLQHTSEITNKDVLKMWGAAGCSISDIVEFASILPPWVVNEQEKGLTTVERLIITASHSGMSEYPSQLAIRYLGGITECHSFWMQQGALFDVVLQKLLIKCIAFLRDLGVDDLSIGRSAQPTESDVEGVENLCYSVIIGTQDHLLIHSRQLTAVRWGSAFSELLLLLRHPPAQTMLPLAWEVATSPAAESLVTTTYSLRPVETLVVDSSLPSIPDFASPFQRLVNRFLAAQQSRSSLFKFDPLNPIIAPIPPTPPSELPSASASNDLPETMQPKPEDDTTGNTRPAPAASPRRAKDSTLASSGWNTHFRAGRSNVDPTTEDTGFDAPSRVRGRPSKPKPTVNRAKKPGPVSSSPVGDGDPEPSSRGLTRRRSKIRLLPWVDSDDEARILTKNYW